jgi:hypothetical protein
MKTKMRCRAWFFQVSLVLLIAPLCAFPSFAQSSSAPSGSLQAQMDNLKCMEEAVQVLDDKISPANAVARGIAVYCIGSGDLAMAWRNIGGMRQMREKAGLPSSPESDMVASWSDIALPMLLKYRASKAASTSK